MLQCFLLLGKGSTWPALFAILSVLAGSVAAICLMLSGIKGIITEWYRPETQGCTHCKPERVVQWIDPSGQPRGQSGRAAMTL